MTAPIDQARLRELAEAVRRFAGDDWIDFFPGWDSDTAAFAASASPSTILALLDTLSAERERADDARTLLFDFVELARVGYGGKPVMRSSRVNVPASLFHTVNAFLATQKAEGADNAS